MVILRCEISDPDHRQRFLALDKSGTRSLGEDRRISIAHAGFTYAHNETILFTSATNFHLVALLL